ncbi:MAG: ABC transporter ATP-binding protein, partial [Promethearchaeota archaeon]
MTEVQYDIRLEDICWTYSGTTSPAIKKINLKVKKGEIIVITGPSGAGKTTVCSCFNGLIPHFHRGELTGNIFVKKMNVKKIDTAIMAGFVGFVFDSPANQLFCTTVREEIAFGPENYCLPVEEILKRVEDAINFSRLNGYEERNPHSLSGGEQQACAIAAIAAMHPSIFVLDEPTSNLDPYGTEIVFDRINELVRSEEKT